jgi:hypothetical protein
MKNLFASLCLLGFLAAGCSEKEPQERTYTDKEKQIMWAARKAVAQFDDWADRAEFKLERRKEQWHVTAWRVEHPEAKGNKRYVPWGRREMVIDDTGKVLSYANDK